MAFLNEFLTEEEITAFLAKGIKNPGNSPIIQPYVWTIDRQKNVFLMKVYGYREPPYETWFILVWKDTPIPVLLLGEWSGDNDRIWNLIRLQIPVELNEQRTEIIQDLKNALKVLQLDGVPNTSWNQNITVQFNF